MFAETYVLKDRDLIEVGAYAIIVDTGMDDSSSLTFSKVKEWSKTEQTDVFSSKSYMYEKSKFGVERTGRRDTSIDELSGGSATQRSSNYSTSARFGAEIADPENRVLILAIAAGFAAFCVAIVYYVFSS